MTKSYSDAYKAAGVDVTAGYKAVELMKETCISYYYIRCIRFHRWFWRIICARYDRHEEASTCIWYRWCWHKAKACDVIR